MFAVRVVAASELFGKYDTPASNTAIVSLLIAARLAPSDFLHVRRAYPPQAKPARARAEVIDEQAAITRAESIASFAEVFEPFMSNFLAVGTTCIRLQKGDTIRQVAHAMPNARIASQIARP